MSRFFFEAGPLIFPVTLLALVILFLGLWNALVLTLRRGAPASRRRHSIDTILFWGSVAAMLGFLGQWIGINKMIHMVVAHGSVSPPAVTYGLSESLLTPVAGMVVLVVSAFLWFLLRLGLWAVERRA